MLLSERKKRIISERTIWANNKKYIATNNENIPKLQLMTNNDTRANNEKYIEGNNEKYIGANNEK